MDNLKTIRNTARKLGKIGSIILHPIVPPDLIFFVTSRCNASCHFCLFHDQVHDRERKKAELTIDEIEQIAKHYGSLTKLSLSGGEPFIRRDIAHIIRLFDTYCKPAIIDVPTNGYYTPAPGWVAQVEDGREIARWRGTLDEIEQGKVISISVVDQPPVQEVLLIRRRESILSGLAFTLYSIFEKSANNLAPLRS